MPENEAINPNDIYIAMIGGIIFFSLLAGFIIYFMFLYRQKQLIHFAEQNRLKAEYEKSVAESHIEIQNDVLRHVSSEIHDNLGAVASILKIHLSTFPMPEKESDKNNLIQSRELLGKLIVDLKSLSLGLNTDYITEKGLSEALENVLFRINQTGVVQAHITYPLEKIELDKGKEIFMFRMGQEILNNMLKHAQGKNIWVNLSIDNDVLFVSYKDDGIGFDVEKMLNQGLAKQHSGLRNLQKRCALIQAELKIVSEAGKGSEFIITLPLNQSIMS